MAGTELRKRQFIDNTMHLLGDTLGATRLTYYSVDAEKNLYDFVSYRMPADFLRTYVREMHAVDPLHVRRLRSETVARMDEICPRTPRSDVEEYERFLRRFDVEHAVDFIFRREGEIKAGLSVMWTRHDRPPDDALFQLAERLHSYIEFNLMEHLPLPREDPRLRAMRLFHLTRREAEVANLLCCGRTNADIAGCLGIGLATVKTHLVHIFEKAGVENRSGLVARLAAAQH